MTRDTKTQGLVILKYVRGIQIAVGLAFLPYLLKIFVADYQESLVRPGLIFFLAGSWAFVDGVFYDYRDTTESWWCPKTANRTREIITIVLCTVWCLIREYHHGFWSMASCLGCILFYVFYLACFRTGRIVAKRFASRCSEDKKHQ